MAGDAPLRIIHCFRSPVGGIFRHVRDLAEAHSRAGHQVGILCDSTTGGAYEDALFDGIRPYLALGLTRLPIRRSVGPSDLRSALAALGHVKNLRPDVLHGHGAKGGVFARAIGTRLRVSGSRVARFYSPHGGSLHYDADRLAGQFYFRVERFLERMTERLIFVSDYERVTYTKKIGTPSVPFQVILNGLRESEFVPVEPVPDAADFLYIGMMRDLKGPDVFIEALAAAERKTGRPITAEMVGDGDDRPRYQAMIDGLGLSARVRMHPAMPARKAFALARTVCIPSRAESMPYIVLEALAAGRPMIASDVGGIPEILGPRNAALTPPGDVEALARQMRRAIEDPGALRAAMPDRQFFRQTFSVERMAERILTLYRECLGEAQAVRTGSFLSNLS